MASRRRILQESFDALMEAKAKRYRNLDQSDPIDEALHQLRVNARPAAQVQYNDDNFHDDGKFRRRDWRVDPKDDYSLPSYRSSSPTEGDDDYYTKNYTRASSRNRDYGPPPAHERDYGHSSSVERDYSGPSSREGEYGHPASRDRDYNYIPSREPSRIHDTDYSSSEMLSDFRSPGLLEEDYGCKRSEDYDLEYSLKTGREFSPPVYVGRGRSPRGKGGMAYRGMVKKGVAGPIKKWNTKRFSPPDNAASHQPNFSRDQPWPPKEVPWNLREQDLEHIDPSDIFSTFGAEIIKWAGFHEAKRDPEYLELYRVLFMLETETCAKMLASFKCSLKPEHQEFCFSIIKPLRHTALKAPKVDNMFLNLLLEKGVVATKNCFFEVIKAFDQSMMRLQGRLLKSTTPLLMACNGYELSSKANSFSDPAQMAAAFESTISLCRKSLVLLGQTFAMASALRQEKILEAVGLEKLAPPPTLFPNLDTCTLFGREYIENLQSWLEKSGCQMKLKGAAPAPAPAAPVEPESQQKVPETRPKIKILQRADRKALEVIERLVTSMVSGTLTARQKNKMKNNPQFWFLDEKESLEYKYYKLKLAEAERSIEKEESKEKKTLEQRASEAVRALMYARKVASIKKRLFQRRRPGILQRGARARKVKKCTVGTQTLLSARMMLKPDGQGTTMSSDKAGPAGEAFSLLELPESSQSLTCKVPEVDSKAMETAEKLATFVAQFGPEIEQFSIDNSADNPDLWFLQDQESSAFKYYRKKVYELCPSINFSVVQETKNVGGNPESVEGDKASLKEEEEEDKEEEANLEEETIQTRTESERRAEEKGRVPGYETEETLSEEVPITMDDLSMAEDTALDSSTQALGPAQDTPCWRKRIASKSLKVGLIPSKRVCLIQPEPEVHEPVRISYDRPRGCPPYKKKKKTKDLEFSHKRLTDKNIGFQMLQKLGWKEGRGLGSLGKGIKEPVKVGSTSAGEGLGVKGEKNKEDTFDVFRERMIQMYNLKKVCK
ncbi:SURP and G-patch domain-containing protein 2 [Tiliqua scincoides]|uniref:SURP and G-patch domain-containing protein 2 n=1 Tax=Tiliqua scincoides TaxID=71010 RepID=UPI0034624D23